MTNKGRVLQQIRAMSSGTIANLIGSTKYVIIDRAATNAALYVSENLTEEECGAIQTMKDLCAVFKQANNK